MLRLRSFGARAVPARLLPRLPLCGTVDTLWTYLLPSESVALRAVVVLTGEEAVSLVAASCAVGGVPEDGIQLQVPGKSHAESPADGHSRTSWLKPAQLGWTWGASRE